MEAFELPEWINVPEITHYHGPDYAFEEGAATWPWSWTQMVAGLTSESMEIVVKGPDGHSRGVVRCEFAPRHNSYDDLTSRALVKAGTPPPNLLRIWDFHSQDSTHPSLSQVALYAGGEAEIEMYR